MKSPNAKTAVVPAKRASRKASKPSSTPTAESTAVPSPAEAEVQDLPEAERIPDVPNVYADAVLDVVFGIYTSKIVLGFETGNANAKPISVVTIPTEALVTACMKILENLGAPGMGGQIVDRHANFARTLQRLAASIEDSETERNRSGNAEHPRAIE